MTDLKSWQLHMFSMEDHSCHIRKKNVSPNYEKYWHTKSKLWLAAQWSHVTPLDRIWKTIHATLEFFFSDFFFSELCDKSQNDDLLNWSWLINFDIANWNYEITKTKHEWNLTYQVKILTCCSLIWRDTAQDELDIIKSQQKMSNVIFLCTFK